MSVEIVETSQDELLALQERKAEAQKQSGKKGGAMAGLSHLNSSIYDWNIERGWGAPNRFIRVAKDSDSGDILGATFWSFTAKGNRHCTLRHIFLFEEARGKGVAEMMYNYYFRHTIESNVMRVRMYANIPATAWHVKCGMRYIAQNKAKQPFTYLPLFDVDNMRELGKMYDKVGPEDCIDLCRPEIEKQVGKIVDRGGRWFTSDEFKEMWGTGFDPEAHFAPSTLPIF